MTPTLLDLVVEAEEIEDGEEEDPADEGDEQTVLHHEGISSRNESAREHGLLLVGKSSEGVRRRKDHSPA